jgi:uncharacterized membrane protein YsdA (DUF1294 family)
MPAAALLVVILALIALNLVTMLRFWQDKQRAVAGMRRIPEADLLTLAFIGGSPGALAARWMFRHKTRKQPFSTRLFLITAIQAGVAIGLAVS